MALPDPAFALPADAMPQPFDEDDLAAHLARQFEPTADDVDADWEGPAARWRIEDDHDAEWAMRMHRDNLARVAELHAQAERYKAEIDAWMARVTKAPTRTAEFFEQHLVDYQRRRREVDPKAATLVLPSGEVKSSQSKPAPEVADPVAVAMWARENLPGPVLLAAVPPQAPKVLVSKLAKHVDIKSTIDEGADGEPDESTREWFVVDANGERVPGMTARPGKLDIKVKPS